MTDKKSKCDNSPLTYILWLSETASCGFPGDRRSWLSVRFGQPLRTERHRPRSQIPPGDYHRGNPPPGPVMFDQGRHDLFVCLEDLDRCRFVFSHQPTVADHVGAEDSRQLAFISLNGHMGYPPECKSPRPDRGIHRRLFFGNLLEIFSWLPPRRLRLCCKIDYTQFKWAMFTGIIAIDVDLCQAESGEEWDKRYWRREWILLLKLIYFSSNKLWE